VAGGSARRQGDDRRDLEVADRDPESLESPHDADASRIGVEPDLLAGLAQRGGHEVRIVGFGLAAREAHLSRVMATAIGALDEHDPRVAGRVGKEQDKDRGRARLATGRWLTTGAPRRSAAQDHGHERLVEGRQIVRHRREARRDGVEAHQRRLSDGLSSGARRRRRVEAP
jgi:hypothetical protein